MTSVRPDGGPIQVDSPNGLNAQAAPGGALVMQVETMGKGVQAVLIGGVLLAALLAGMALMRTESLLDQFRAEQTRHLTAEAELRSRFEATDTEARMAEYYILELDGKLMAGGFIPPSRGYGQWKQERKK